MVALHCSTRTLSCSMWDLVTPPGTDLVHLQWECRVLTRGPPGKFHSICALKPCALVPPAFRGGSPSLVYSPAHEWVDPFSEFLNMFECFLLQTNKTASPSSSLEGNSVFQVSIYTGHVPSSLFLIFESTFNTLCSLKYCSLWLLEDHILLILLLSH